MTTNKGSGDWWREGGTKRRVTYLTKYAGHTVWFSKASIDGGGLVPLWKDVNNIEDEEEEA